MRVLITTITAGGGHLQAAAALQEAWLQTRRRTPSNAWTS